MNKVLTNLFVVALLSSPTYADSPKNTELGGDADVLPQVDIGESETSACEALQQCWEQSLADPSLANHHAVLQDQAGQIAFSVDNGREEDCIQVGMMYGEIFVGMPAEMQAMQQDLQQITSGMPSLEDQLADLEWAKEQHAKKTPEELEAELQSIPPSQRAMLKKSWDDLMSGEAERLLRENAKTMEAALGGLSVAGGGGAPSWPSVCPWVSD